MASSRPRRATKKPKRYLQSPERTLQPAQLARKKASRQALSQALKPIAVKSIAEPAILKEILPSYLPPRLLRYINGQPGTRGANELQTFRKFLINKILSRIVTAIKGWRRLLPSRGASWEPLNISGYSES
jgi:hypothetical protein